jgi:hypothetical protein
VKRNSFKDEEKNKTHTSYYIKYYPELKKAFCSPFSALIFERLEYWSQRSDTQKGFWKFFEPCSHPLYQEGDSWQEEIGITRKVWAKAFAIIGTHYKTKTAFLKEKDPFKGKLYASYYDRRERRTYYLRNHSFIQTFLENIPNKLREIGKIISRKKTIQSSKDIPFQGSSKNFLQGNSFTRAYKDISSSKEILTSPPTPLNSLPSSSPVGERKNFEEKKKDNASEESISQAMVTVWNQKVPEAPLKISLSWRQQRKLRKALEESFNNSPEEWEAYCERIAANGFLMGGGVRKWKATLLWSIRPENIEKVKTEGYFSGQKESASVIREREKPLSSDEIEGPEKWKNFCLDLSLVIGISTFRSWILDVKPVDLDGEYPKLKCLNDFRAGKIRSKFLQKLENTFKEHYPSAKSVEIIY